MKRNWTIDELIDHWTLTPGERELAKQAVGANNQWGRALLLKWFQYAGVVSAAEARDTVGYGAISGSSYCGT
jgi:hypothetical protein